MNPRRSLIIKALVLITMIGCLGALAWSKFGGRSKDLPVVAILSDFALTDQNGTAYSVQNLKGALTIVNFIFTTCPGECPLFTKQMKKVQDRVEKELPEVKLLSISVDPTNDTPEVLKKYATENGSDFNRWSFVTGDLEKVQNVVVKGFLSSIPDGDKDTNIMDISHSHKFVIVDREARIRGFYEAKNNSEITEILEAVKRL